jgi:hypothetical protein
MVSRSSSLVVALVLGACARPLLGPEPDEGGADGESSAGGSSSSAAMDDVDDTSETGPGGGECHPSYSPCLPMVDDLDCPDVVAMGVAPVTVVGPDDYGLDADADGIGCEP